MSEVVSGRHVKRGEVKRSGGTSKLWTLFGEQLEIGTKVMKDTVFKFLANVEALS